MPDKSIREFVRERMHEGNGGRLHLHRVFDATRKAYPRKVVPFDYVQRIATEWFRDGATSSISTRSIGADDRRPLSDRR
jgi:hypothetical protein